MTSCTDKAPIEEKFHEQYRPQFHFTPDHNWTNDPNGLVYYNGEYHIFYQYNPFGNRWGHMSWGHAVSKDLITWEHLPVAITEYTELMGDSVMIFSGSAVVDKDNTSGFFDNGSGGMVAIFTSHVHRNNQQLKQYQSIAFSSDNGRSFTRYDKNPVLDIGRKDFRDPKVFWYEPQKKWVLAAVVPDLHKAQLYESKNLKEWKLLSEFGPLGDTAKIWECPDLFEVAMENEPNKKKWVMIISNSHPQGPTYVGMQYFIGDFDGTTFTPDQPSQYPLYLDYGKDFYAGVTFNHVPDGRAILLGWVNNWAYANDIPTTPWKGAMSLPRELYLFESPDGLRLKQVPVRELDKLKRKSSEGDDISSALIEVKIQPVDSTGKIGIKLFDNVLIGYDQATHEIIFDRTQAGNTSFHKDFPGVDRVPARLIDGVVKLEVYVDQSIIEVYVNGGEATLTDQVFVEMGSTKIERWGEGGKVEWGVTLISNEQR